MFFFAGKAGVVASLPLLEQELTTDLKEAMSCAGVYDKRLGGLKKPSFTVLKMMAGS